MSAACLTAVAAAGPGISVGPSSTLADSSAARNRGLAGVRLQIGATARGCAATTNTGHGFGSSSLVARNMADAAASYGIGGGNAFGRVMQASVLGDIEAALEFDGYENFY